MTKLGMVCWCLMTLMVGCRIGRYISEKDYLTSVKKVDTICSDKISKHFREIELEIQYHCNNYTCYNYALSHYKLSCIYNLQKGID